MTICWQVPYGSTTVFEVLRYHSSDRDLNGTGTVKKKYRGSTVVPWYRPTLVETTKKLVESISIRPFNNL